MLIIYASKFFSCTVLAKIYHDVICTQWLIFTGTVTFENSKLHNKECLNVLSLGYIPTAKYNMSSYVRTVVFNGVSCMYLLHVSPGH